MNRPVTVYAVMLMSVAIALGSSPSYAQPIHSDEHSFRLVKLAEPLEYPWGLAFLPDGRMLVTERPGRLRVIGRDGKLDARPVSGLPGVAAQGQGGLLDVAIHPQFSANNLIYQIGRAHV